MRYGINLRRVPPGATKFGVRWVDASPGIPLSPPAKGAAGTQEWNIDRAIVKPFSFAQISKKPEVTIRFVKITQMPFNSLGEVTGDIVFDVKRPVTRGSKDVEVSLLDGSVPESSFISPTKSSVWRRVCRLDGHAAQSQNKKRRAHHGDGERRRKLAARVSNRAVRLCHSESRAEFALQIVARADARPG